MANGIGGSDSGIHVYRIEVCPLGRREAAVVVPYQIVGCRGLTDKKVSEFIGRIGAPIGGDKVPLGFSNSVNDFRGALLSRVEGHLQTGDIADRSGGGAL